ncbi:hypothetical protein H5410_001951 [Solanum commersonii]|uniref:Uncharacterized protein n=1 Tax=Solanum commersonii TaxID=4109 RepID=A0A9J6B103_SOLCO|nr:hypothetical protein H5410_001951 [Solanum commersonii]
MEIRLRTTKGLIGRCHNRFPIFLIPLSSLRVQKWKLPLLMKTLKKLFRTFCEVNMVQVGEGTRHADVQLVGSGVEGCDQNI